MQPEHCKYLQPTLFHCDSYHLRMVSFHFISFLFSFGFFLFFNFHPIFFRYNFYILFDNSGVLFHIFRLNGSPWVPFRNFTSSRSYLGHTSASKMLNSCHYIYYSVLILSLSLCNFYHNRKLYQFVIACGIWIAIKWRPFRIQFFLCFFHFFSIFFLLLHRITSQSYGSRFTNLYLS